VSHAEARVYRYLRIRRLAVRDGPDVLRPRTNELPGGVLFDRVADPADGPADGKQRQRRSGWEAQHARQGGEGEVDRRLFAQGCRRGEGVPRAV
jgi:hypothetical protein